MRAALEEGERVTWGLKLAFRPLRDFKLETYNVTSSKQKLTSPEGAALFTAYLSQGSVKLLLPEIQFVFFLV